MNYLLNLNLGYERVKRLIEVDIEYSKDIGANELFCDLKITLDLYEMYCKKNDISKIINMVNIF